jgi:NAD(P)-dependent dehydrogenase (short-subunit alcohol dehydrogenase family)
MIKSTTAPDLFSPTAFEGLTAVIAGGGSGIGRAIAERLAKHGCAVAVADFNEAAARETAAGIQDVGGDAFVAPCDVTSPPSIQAALGRILQWRSRVDLLVNCVGIVVGGTLATIEAEAWRRSFQVNLDGVLNMCQALFPELSRSPAGSVVNIGSLAGRGAYPGGGGYGPSKAALMSLSHQLAIEWAPSGVRVNVINPATTLTPLVHQLHSAESLAQRARATPLGRLVDPDEVAMATCFLLSAGASAITAQALDIDCGMSQTLVNAIKSAPDSKSH